MPLALMSQILVTKATGLGTVFQKFNLAGWAVAPEVSVLTILTLPTATHPAMLIDKASCILARVFQVWLTEPACHRTIRNQLRLASWAVAPIFGVLTVRVSPSITAVSMFITKARVHSASWSGLLTGTAGSWTVYKDLMLANRAISPPLLGRFTTVEIPEPTEVTKLIPEVPAVLARCRSHGRRGDGA